MTATPANEVRFAALRHRNFTLLWAGLLVSNVGTWMQNVALGWLCCIRPTRRCGWACGAVRRADDRLSAVGRRRVRFG